MYYYRKVCDRYYGSRYRVHDDSRSVGAEHMCIADCSDEWRAKVIVDEMNKGLPYRPDICYEDYIALSAVTKQ